MGTVLLLALTASLNPTLVAATTVMLLLDKPTILMLGYLCGALMTSFTLGLVIVFSLSGSSTTKTTQHTLSPAVDIALGALALVIAWVLATGGPERLSGRRESRKAKKADKGPPRWRRELSKGSPRVTFAVGAVLSLPGASYIAGLTAIHKLHYSTTATVVTVLCFNMIQLWLLEVPLVSFAVAPNWTPAAITRITAWFGRNSHRYTVRGLPILGGMLMLKGAAGLVVR